jgi:hypothetical protein
MHSACSRLQTGISRRCEASYSAPGTYVRWHVPRILEAPRTLRPAEAGVHRGLGSPEARLLRRVTQASPALGAPVAVCRLSGASCRCPSVPHHRDRTRRSELPVPAGPRTDRTLLGADPALQRGGTVVSCPLDLDAACRVIRRKPAPESPHVHRSRPGLRRENRIVTAPSPSIVTVTSSPAYRKRGGSLSPCRRRGSRCDQVAAFERDHLRREGKISATCWTCSTPATPRPLT